MRGSVQKNKGKYYPVVYDNIQKQHKWGRGCTSPREAEKELRQMLRKYDDHSLVFGRSEKFSAVYDEFVELELPTLFRSKNSVTTLMGNYNKHVLPIFGNVPVDRITKQDILRLINTMRVSANVDGVKQAAPASLSTKHKLLQNLNVFFKYCIDTGRIAETENPCSNINLKTPAIHEPETWTDEEITNFLEYEPVRTGKYYLAFCLLANTGISRSEALGLQRNDYHGTFFVLDRGVDVYGDYTDMKNSHRRRRIELMGFLSQLIDEHITMQNNRAKAAPNASIPVHILTDEYNNPLKATCLSHAFLRLRRKYNNEHDVKLPDIPLKNLRHSYATSMLYSGESLGVVSESLGHSKKSTTQNYYQGAAARTLHREAIERMEERRFKKPLGKPLGESENMHQKKSV